MRIVAYALGGLFAAFAGIALVAATQSADASQSIQYTLPALAAVAIGGTSLLGGRGSLTGSIAGAAIMYLIQTLLDSLAVSDLWLQLVYGALLIVAIVLSSTLAAPRAARGRRRERDAAPAARAGGAGPSSARPRRARRCGCVWAPVQRRFPIVQLIALVVLFEWGTWTITDFATRQSVLSMLVAAAFLGLAGAGQTLVVLVGGIDFSVPAFISAASVVISQLTGTDHWAFVPALASASWLPLPSARSTATSPTASASSRWWSRSAWRRSSPARCSSGRRPRRPAARRRSSRG